MEPSYRVNKNVNGNIGIEELNKAPLVGWTNHDSPNLSPAFGNTNKGISSPAKISLDTWSPTASSSEYLDGELTSKSDDPFASAETVPLKEYPEKSSHSDDEDNNERSLLNPNNNNSNSRIKIVSSNRNINNGNNNETIAVRFENDSEYDDNVSECQDDDGDSICSSSAEISTAVKPKPNYPDGGWGWVVVISSFFISTIADGISFSFGLLFIKLVEAFGQSTSKTAWIGSLFMAVPLLFGPIGSALVDRYGCRSMTIVGGLVSALGFFLSAFSESIEMMYLTFGVIAGLGLGLCYVTAVVSIAYWFDKKRTLATGLGACGTGFGTVVYAPMTQYFIDTYGWRGTIILLAGTFLNMCVWGAVMRDPEWWAAEQLAKHNSSSCASLSMRSEGGKTSLGEGNEKNDFPGVEEIKRRLLARKAEYTMTGVATMTPGGALHLDPEKLTVAASDCDPKKLPNFHSVLNLPTFVKQSEKVPLEVLETLSTNNRWFKLILENYPSLLLSRSLSESARLASLASDNDIKEIIHATTHFTPSTPATSPSSPPVLMSMRLERVPENPTEKPYTVPAVQNNISNGAQPSRLRSSLHKRTKPEGSFKKQITSGCIPAGASPHYLKNIRVHRNSVMYRGAILNIHPYRLRASSCPDIFRNSMTTIAKETEEKWYTDILELFKGMVDFSMFLELHFLLMSLSTILLFTWFIVPYFYIADFMKTYKFTEASGSQIISIIGVLNTIGMVALGWGGDQPWMNVSKAYSFCLIMCGFATLTMPLVVHDFYLMAVCGAFFGLFFASSFSFTPVIVVQLVPIERFTTGYGLVLLCQGIGNLTGPPLAGLCFDLTGYWNLSFYLAGINIIIAGILIGIIPMTKNRLIWGTGTLEKDSDSAV